MEKLKGRRPSPALLVAVVALVAALGGGAVAGVAVTSLNKKEKKQVKKIAKKQAKKQSKKAVKGIPEGPQGPAGPAGPQGGPGPTGPKGDAGEPGTARAYGRVDPEGLSRSQNIAAVTETAPNSGVFCITPSDESGIDPSNSVLTATPDYSRDTTKTGAGFNMAMAHVEWNSGAFLAKSCDPEQFEVRTYELINTDLSGDQAAELQENPQAFSFVIP